VTQLHFLNLKRWKRLKLRNEVTTNFQFKDLNFALQNLCSHCVHGQGSSHRLMCQKAWVNFVAVVRVMVSLRYVTTPRVILILAPVILPSLVLSRKMRSNFSRWF